ncbi:MAG: CRISPR-associated primase-polymerase type A1, partial [Thermodesulfobacteriota bacterium]
DAPGSVEALRRLAEACQDEGKSQQAARCWNKIIELEPDHPDHYVALGSLWEETGDLEAAADAYRRGIERTGAQKLKAFLGRLRPPKPELKPAAESAPLPEETDLVRFCHLFEGREGVYARQWVGADGKSGYTPFREPFTPAVARNHILGNFTVGIYPLRMDNTVRFLAFDIDVPSYEVARNITDRRAWETLLKKAHQAAERIAQAGDALKLRFHLEDSGFKGRHCWLFFREPAPGFAARRFARSLLEQVKIETPGVQVEVFPKQAAIKGNGLGNLIKLPLGIHRASGRRSLFLGPDGKAVTDQLAYLAAIEPVGKELFLALLREVPAPRAAVVPEKAGPEEEGEAGKETPRAAPGPGVVERYDPEIDPELQYLLLKCEVLRTIVETVNQEGRIGHEESVVLAHTVGHLSRGPEAYNALLRRAANVEPSQFLVSRLKGNPISCPKIRKRLPRVTSAVTCDCRFDLNLYPSPVRHVETMSVAAPAAGVTVDSLRFEQLLREYLKVKGQVADLLKLIQRYEKTLADIFEESGADEIRSSQGVLKMVKEPDGRLTFALTI